MLTEYPRIGERVRRETLPNGLPVIIVEKKDYRRKYAMFATRYGGMDMRFFSRGRWVDTPAGIAHYLEHKMFDTEDGNALQELAKNGAEPNAFTANDMTCYYFDCTHHFTDNLRLLLSFVSVPYFTDESVAKEQGIIAQEIRMIEDNPEWQVYHNLMQCLYHNSPAKTPVAGSVDSIRKITAKTLYRCHKAFYTPANMCLVVVGDVDGEEVLALANEVLGSEKGKPVPRDYGAEEDLLPAQKETAIAMEVSMTNFLAGCKCPPLGSGEERYRQNIVGDLACDILLGESSPLYARLYAQGLINGTFGYDYDALPGAAYLTFGGDSADPHAVVDAVLAEVARLRREGLDESYYLRVRNANLGDTIRSLNSFESIAIGFVEGCFHGFDPNRFPEIYDSITTEDILRFLADNLTREKLAMSIITAKEG